MLYLEAEVKAMMMLLFAVKDNTFFFQKFYLARVITFFVFLVCVLFNFLSLRISSLLLAIN